MAKAPRTGRCIHCLGLFPKGQMTADRLPARSWYSQPTPSTVQRWKVPCCRGCYDDLSRVESDLVIRLRLRIKPGNMSESPVVPIPYPDLSKVAEKYGKGCEYKLRNRYVEPPYGLRTFIGHPDEIRAEFDGEQLFDLGPGFKIKCVRHADNPCDVAYWFLLWDTVCLKVFIAFESVLTELEPNFSRLKALTLDDILQKRQLRVAAGHL